MFAFIIIIIIIIIIYSNGIDNDLLVNFCQSLVIMHAGSSDGHM